MEPDIEQRLWDFIDGRCTLAETALIQAKLDQDLHWKQTYDELISVHGLLATQELEMPSLRFSKNVMEQIAGYHIAPATRDYINKNIIRAIGGFFLLTIAGICVYLLANLTWTSHVSPPRLASFSTNIEKISPGRIGNSGYVNIFIGINAILALILCDKYMHRNKNKAGTGSQSAGHSA